MRSQLGRYRLDNHPDPGRLYCAMTDQLLNDAFSARNGDRKANALSFAVNGRVDADQFAFDVEQRAAGIAGINRGIGLDEIVVRSPISVKRAIQGADDAG